MAASVAQLPQPVAAVVPQTVILAAPIDDPAQRRAQRDRERKAHYLRSTVDFEKDVLRPLSDSVNDLVDIAVSLGKASGCNTALVLDPTNPERKMDRADLSALVTNCRASINDISMYHKYALKYSKSELDPTKAKRSNSFSTMVKYQTVVAEFFLAAAERDSRFAAWKSLPFLTPGAETYCIAPSHLLTQLMNTYTSALSLKHEINGQLIRPDDVMLRHFSPQITAALERQHARFEVDKAYPGLIRRPFIQTIFSLLQDQGAKTDPRIQALVKSQDLISAGERDVAAMRLLRLKVQSEVSSTVQPKEKSTARKQSKVAEKAELLRKAQSNILQGLSPNA